MKKGFCLIVFLVLLLTMSMFCLVACNNKNVGTNGSEENALKTYIYNFEEGGKEYKYEANIIYNDCLESFKLYCDDKEMCSDDLFLNCETSQDESKIIIKENGTEINRITFNKDGTLSFSKLINTINWFYPSSLFVGNYTFSESNMQLNADGTGTLEGLSDAFIWKSYYGTKIVVSTNESFVGQLYLYDLDLNEKTAKDCGNVYASLELEPLVYSRSLDGDPNSSASKISDYDKMYLQNDNTATYMSAIMEVNELGESVVSSYDYYFGRAPINNDGINLIVGDRGENVVQSGNVLQFMWTQVDEDGNPYRFEYAHTFKCIDEEGKNYTFCNYYYGDAYWLTNDSFITGKYCDIDNTDDYFEIKHENENNKCFYYVFNKNNLSYLMCIGKTGYVGVPSNAIIYNNCDESSNSKVILFETESSTKCYYYGEYENLSNPGTYTISNASNFTNRLIYSLKVQELNSETQLDYNILIMPTNNTYEFINLSLSEVNGIEFAYDKDRSLVFKQTDDYKYYYSNFNYDNDTETYTSELSDIDYLNRTYYLNFDASADLSDYSNKLFEFIVIKKESNGYYCLGARKCSMVSYENNEIRFYDVNENDEIDDTYQYTLKLNENGVYEETSYHKNAVDLIWEK